MLLSIYSESLSNIEGVSIYPLISLAIFFLFFVGMLWWVFTRSRGYIDSSRRIPLTDGTDSETQFSTN